MKKLLFLIVFFTTIYPFLSLYAFAGEVAPIAASEDESYFTITNTHVSTSTDVSMKKSHSKATTRSFRVRIIDANGEVITNWTTKNVTNTDGISFGSIPAGGKMQIYGNNAAISTTLNHYLFFTISGGSAAVSGNLLSLVAFSDGTGVNNSFPMPAYCFYYLFKNCMLFNAENLEMPSTTLAPYCYGNMFSGCTFLSKPPQTLPATDLANSCYYAMFDQCSSLTMSPEIQATDFSDAEELTSMFDGCAQLTKIRTHHSEWGHSIHWVRNVSNAGVIYCPPTLPREYDDTQSGKMPRSSAYPWTIFSYNLTFVNLTSTWSDGTNDDRRFTWQTDTSEVETFLKSEQTFHFYTDADCTEEITPDDIRVLLSTQREADADITYYIYAKSVSSDIVLEDNRENSFYDTFKAKYDGAEDVTVVYNRQFPKSKWATLCLPFDVNSALLNSVDMGGRVYEFKKAEGNAETGINLYFATAATIKAGKGYIVNANAKLAAKSSFRFPEVKINLEFDKGDELNSQASYDKLEGTSTEGNIELVGTLRKGRLRGVDGKNRYMGLKDNKIYYPNISTAEGSLILAYRGIFRSIEGTLNAERIRIVVDGEDMGELLIEKDGEMNVAGGNRSATAAPSRKYMQDGVLFIEREGVVYDATGKKVVSRVPSET